jgi:hypothetical protein
MPAAAVILDEIGKVMKEIGRPHNQECRGMPRMFDFLRLGQKEILLLSDSNLNAEYPVKITELKVPFQRAMTWLRQFDAYRIVMGAASWTIGRSIGQ